MASNGSWAGKGHLQGMTEKLRSGVNGKVREAIQQSVARIVVRVDGTVKWDERGTGSRVHFGMRSGCINQKTLPRPHRENSKSAFAPTSPILTEKLRSGVNRKVREAIQQSVARILVHGWNRKGGRKGDRF